MLAGPEFVSVDPDRGLYPYDLVFLTFFARLMDNLTYDEEEEPRAAPSGSSWPRARPTMRRPSPGPSPRRSVPNPPGKNYLFPTKLIRQSPKEDHMLFWHEIGAADIPASMKPKEKLNPETLANELVEFLTKSNEPLTAGQLRDLARER